MLPRENLPDIPIQRNLLRNSGHERDALIPHENSDNYIINIEKSKSGNLQLPDSDYEDNRLGIRGILSSKKHSFRSRSSAISESLSVQNFQRKRLVSQEGDCDLKFENIPDLHERFYSDLFHTLIDVRWRWITVLFSICFVGSWVIFGSLWWLIVILRKTPNLCIDNVNSWTAAFLFSVETQSTIGYGGRQVTAECPEGVILLVIQTVVGMFINCSVLGLIFTKVARPKNRGKTVVFSKKAVVTMRDSNLCLMFRFVDIRRRRLFDCNLRAVMIRPNTSDEGEFIPLDMADLQLTLDNSQVEFTMRLFPIYPLTVLHVITEESPFYEMTKTEMEQADFEIVLILEGTVPTTGMVTQALTSYRAQDLFWGYRFKPMFNGNNLGQHLNKIDLATLDDTYTDNVTAPLSAAELDEKKEEQDRLKAERDDYDSLKDDHRDSTGYESGHSSIGSVFTSPKQTRPDDAIRVFISSDSMHQLTGMKETNA